MSTDMDPINQYLNTIGRPHAIMNCAITSRVRPLMMGVGSHSGDCTMALASGFIRKKVCSVCKGSVKSPSNDMPTSRPAASRAGPPGVENIRHDLPSQPHFRTRSSATGKRRREREPVDAALYTLHTADEEQASHQHPAMPSHIGCQGRLDIHNPTNMMGFCFSGY